MQTFSQRFRFLSTLLFLLTLSTFSSAQQAGEPEKVTNMRKIYEAELVKRKLPVLKKLATDLLKLEAALNARHSRSNIEAQIKSLGAKVSTRRKTTAKTPSPKAKGEMKAFNIPMSAASIQGRLKRPGSGAFITNWVTTNCIATRSGGQVTPGFYDVSIDEELSQDFHCVIPPEADRTTMKVGTFKLGTALGFTIRAKSKNPYGILRLHGVTFKPSAQQ